jgi:CHASE3 domain sensor protein
MKIRNKLLIGFGSLTAILLVLTLISYDRMGSLNEQLNQVYQDDEAKRELDDIAASGTKVLEVLETSCVSASGEGAA